MKWQQPQDNFYENSDEHNAPTEPMMPIYPSPSAVTIPNGVPTIDGSGIPTPTPHERPFPYQDLSQNVAPGAFGLPATPVYPVLPPSPKNAKKGREGGKRPIVKTQPQRKPSPFPMTLGAFFVLVQLLLLVRFVLRLLNLPGNTLWIGVIYAMSGIFVLPFRLLLQNISFPIPNALEIYTLIAILVYGLLSRLIVHLLKALLH